VENASLVSECYYRNKALTRCAMAVWLSNYRRLQDFVQDIQLIDIQLKKAFGKVYAYVLYCRYDSPKNSSWSREAEVRVYFSVPIHYWEEDIDKDILKNIAVEELSAEVDIPFYCRESKGEMMGKEEKSKLKEGLLPIFKQNAPSHLTLTEWCNGWKRAGLDMDIYIEKSLYRLDYAEPYWTHNLSIGIPYMDLVVE
ncbi:MAG: hypothetical protein ACPLSA_04130, partial [Caldanaerobacter sp.]